MLLNSRNAICLLVIVTVQLAFYGAASAQPREPEYSDWPERTRIQGRVIVSHGLTSLSGLKAMSSRIFQAKTVVVIGGGATTSLWRAELKNAVGADGRIIDVPDVKTLSVALSKLQPTKQSESAEGEVELTDNGIHGRLNGDQIRSADVVIVEDGVTQNLESLRSFFHSLLARSGTVILEGSAGSSAGKYSMKSVGVDLLSASLDLVPDSLIVFRKGDASRQTDIERRASKLVAANGPLVALLLDSNTAFMLSGRKITCFGAGKVTALVPESDVTKQYRQQISEYKSPRLSPSEYLLDLTQWRRLSMERELPQFPPKQPPMPHVENGTLLIVGGGGSPRGLMSRFVELAGGVENAKLVYVPCSEQDEVSARQSMVAAWKRMGIKHATFLHTKDRSKADSDQKFLAPLKDATGLFFGGGRQWNFSDSYYGTTAHRLMKEVLDRGGVIAGSSAGASIQARYLARATPIGNFDIMAPGYERGGLGFVGGVAIDQHFSQRGRQKDMLKLMQAYPQLLGIGLDEATAIEVQKSTAKVTGKGRVFFYNATAPSSASDQNEIDDEKPADDAVGEAGEFETPFVALPAGSIYDLAKRTVVVDATEKVGNEPGKSGDD